MRSGLSRRIVGRGFDYEIVDTWEAGIALMGPEVKSLRDGRANLGDSFATVHRGEAWLEKLHISAYEPADACQSRRSAETPESFCCIAAKSIVSMDEFPRRGLTLVPLTVYFLRGRAKVELALARGKHRHDKRETIRRREQDRETQRAMRRHHR